MLAHPVPRPGTRPFKAWVWVLLCAVLLQGAAGAVVQAVGRAHTHQALQTAPATGWFESLLAWRAARLHQVQATGVFKHATRALALADHHHEGLERHHHETGDASVQAVDSAHTDAAADAGQPAAGNAAPVWGPTAEYRATPAAPAGLSWPGAAAPRWRDALARLPERPPRA